MSFVKEFLSDEILFRMLYEGGEDHETLASRFESINEFLKSGKLSNGTIIFVWEGGDLKYLCLKCGLSGNFATHDQCLWCEVPRGDLCSLIPAKPRTINSIRILSHLPPLDQNGKAVWPFTCPGCSIVFSSESEHAKEQLSEDQRKMFPTIHIGCMWHRAPCTTTPIDRMVPCVLHMRLRFVSTLWDWCIAPSAMVKTAEVAARILEMLQQDGVNTSRLRKLNNFDDILAVKKASFDGQGCDRVLARFDAYLLASRSNFRVLG